jgi:uncharacterized protein (UPF0147 family)
MTMAKKVAESVTYTLLDSYIKDTSIPVDRRRATLEDLRAIHERLTD